jgi:hypothetical protein
MNITGAELWFAATAHHHENIILHINSLGKNKISKFGLWFILRVYHFTPSWNQKVVSWPIAVGESSICIIHIYLPTHLNYKTLYTLDIFLVLQISLMSHNLELVFSRKTLNYLEIFLGNIWIIGKGCIIFFSRYIYISIMWSYFYKTSIIIHFISNCLKKWCPLKINSSINMNWIC